MINSKLCKGPFLKLIITNFFFWLGIYIFIPILPIYFHDMGMDDHQIGLIVGVFSLGAILFRFMAGKAADEYGCVPVCTIGLLIACISIGGYFISTTFAFLLLLRFLHGVGSSGYSSAAVTMVTLMNKAEDTKDAVALYTLCSMIGIGIATSSAIWIFNIKGFNGILLISGITLLISLILIPKRLVEKEKDHNQELLPLKSIVSNPMIYMPTLIQFAVYVCYSSVMTYLPLMMYSSNADKLWLFYIAYTISVVSSRFLVSKISSLIETRKLSLLILLILIISLFLPVFFQYWIVLIPIGLGIGLGVGLATPILVSSITSNIDSSNRGAALGIFTTAIDLGMGTGSIVMGIIAEYFGYKIVFTTVALYTLLTGVIYYYRINQKKLLQDYNTS